MPAVLKRRRAVLTLPGKLVIIVASAALVKGLSDYIKQSFNSSSSSVETRCPPELGRRSTVCSRLYFCTIKFTVLFGILKVTEACRCDIPLWIRATGRDLLTIDTAGMLNKLIYFKVNLTVFSKISIILTLKVHLHWHFLKWQEQTAQDSMSLIVWTRAGMSKFYWLALQASQLSDIFMLNTVTW